MFVINSPSNPSGAVYSLDELKALGAVLRKHPHILIATDDMYEHILLSGQKFVNIANACPDLLLQTIVLNGVSKAYAMTGWRIGWTLAPENVSRLLWRTHANYYCDGEYSIPKHFKSQFDISSSRRSCTQWRSIMY